MENNSQEKQEVWRDITDPRRAEWVDDLEAGLKEPEFENLEIPEHLGPVKEIIDDHKIKRYAFELDDYLPWSMQEGVSPFDGKRIGQAGILTSPAASRQPWIATPSRRTLRKKGRTSALRS